MPPSFRHCTPAVIISAGWTPGAYDIVRAIGMGGIPTCVASSQSHDIAFSSRYCSEKLVLPELKPEHYPDILKILQQWSNRGSEKPVLFYASDPELDFMWRCREQLEPFYRFVLPSNELLESLFNKVRFSDLAIRLDLPIPPTYTVASRSALRSLINDIAFPCIVKPAYSQDWAWETAEQYTRFGSYKNALRRFDSPEALLVFCEALPDRSSGFVIQSYIDGRDEMIVSFHGYFDEDSRCLGSFLGRKIRTYPPHTGGSAYVRTIHNPGLIRLSIEYLQRIRFQGIVKIDYKWDAREQQFKLLEINPRYNLWELLGAYAGVNLALIAYYHQRGGPIFPQHDYTDDVRLLFFKQDLRAYWTGYRKTREWTMGAYLKSLTKKKVYRIYDPTDPLPFWRSSVAFLKRIVLRLLGIRRVFPFPPRSVPTDGDEGWLKRVSSRGIPASV